MSETVVYDVEFRGTDEEVERAVEVLREHGVEVAFPSLNDSVPGSELIIDAVVKGISSEVARRALDAARQVIPWLKARRRREDVDDSA